MDSKLPDEFFRRRPEDDSDDGVVAEPTQETASAEARQEATHVVAWPTAAAVVIMLSALVLGYLIAALVFIVLPADSTGPGPDASTAKPVPSPGVTKKEGLYGGPTIAVSPTEWESDCEDGSMDWRDGRGFWTCSGDGVGQRLRFTFEPAEEIVGIKLIGGNDATVDQFEAERRITAVRWRFSDGSWFEQGLPSDTVLTQEVGFPRVVATSVEVEVISSTEPGKESADAVTISQLQFLAPA